MILPTYENWVKAHTTEIDVLWEKFQREFKDYIPEDKDVVFQRFKKFCFINSTKYVPDKELWLTEETFQEYED